MIRGLVFGGFLALVACDVGLAADNTQTTKMDQATVSAQAAEATALAHVTGKIGEVELEHEQGKLVYSIDVESASGRVEVEVDANTGRYLGVEKKTDEGDDD